MKRMKKCTVRNCIKNVSQGNSETSKEEFSAPQLLLFNLIIFIYLKVI